VGGFPHTPSRNWEVVFGPVASRRLGWSLGVDVLPPKTCTFDCIYCEAGRTTLKTVDRLPYICKERILEEVTRYLAEMHPVPDVITITASGEPTLHQDLDWILARIKRLTPLPLAVLTNGSLLHLEAVRKALLPADVVIPSLDAARESSFRAVNRPHPDLDLSAIVEGLVRFRRDFPNQLWLEILLVRGVNDSEEDISLLEKIVPQIRPDRIQLNTVVRPPALQGVLPVDPPVLEALCGRLGKRAEIIASFPRSDRQTQGSCTEEDILRMLKRRPCGLKEISTALDVPLTELEALMHRLVRDKRVHRRMHSGASYFQVS